jgi:hypothetical protein
MPDLQMHHLNRSRIEGLRDGEYYLRLEPLSLKRKRLEGLQVGDWIDLGEEAPLLEVARSGQRRFAVHPLERGIRIGDPFEETSPELPERKRVLLEGRLAVLPPEEVVPGERLHLPWEPMERIYLYVEGRLHAIATLIAYEGGYALEVLERLDG